VPKSFLPFFTSQAAGKLTMIGARRMLGRQTIFDGDDGLTRIVDDPFQHRILHVGAPEHPAAAVEMQINPARPVRGDRSQRDFVTVLADDRSVRPIP
jgi:hypothetical protein